jgi:hypothetical protein
MGKRLGRGASAFGSSAADTPGTSTAADFVNQISSEYFALDYRVRPRSTWVINATYAQVLSGVLDSTSRPIFALAGGIPSATIDEGNSDSRLFGRP